MRKAVTTSSVDLFIFSYKSSFIQIVHSFIHSSHSYIFVHSFKSFIHNCQKENFFGLSYRQRSSYLIKLSLANHSLTRDYHSHYKLLFYGLMLSRCSSKCSFILDISCNRKVGSSESSR